MTPVLPVGPMALKLACAHATVRAVRVAQEHGPLGGGDGLVVRGVHVHHWTFGAALLVGQQLLAGRLSVPVRRNAVAVGAALVLEELDVVCGQDGWRAADRALLDGALVDGLLALAAACGVRRPADAVQHWRH